MKKNTRKFTDTQRMNWLQKAIDNPNIKGFRANDHATWEAWSSDMEEGDDGLPCFRSIRNAIDNAMREERE